jgi:hypothetical protein
MDKNKLESPALPNNFQGNKPKDDSAPKIDGGKAFTPSTSQSNDRGKDGTK